MDQQKQWELEQGLSSTTEGIAIDVDWGNRLVEVNVNGQTMRVPWFGAPPWPGDRVRIISAGLRPVCTLIEGAPNGTVQTTAANFVTVLGDDGVTYRYPHFGSAPANGSRVGLDHARRAVVGVYSTEPIGSDFVPPPVPTPPPTGGGSGWFAPVWSASWWNGAYNSGFVETSYTRVAAYGYGTSIADTIPDAAAITRAEWHLIVEWDKSGSSTPASAGVHGHDARPVNMPATDLSGTVLVPRGATVIDIRGAVADALKVGTARGLGFRPNASWWRRYGAAPNSGRIYMEWS